MACKYSLPLFSMGKSRRILLLALISLFGFKVSYGNTPPTYKLDITYLNDTLLVDWSLSWTNNTNDTLEQIPLTFLFEAVAHKQSFYRKEKIEDQKKDLHFRDKAQISHITQLTIQSNSNEGSIITDPIQPEVKWLKLNANLPPNEEILLHGSMRIHIGNYDVIGWRKEGLWIQHILPLISSYDEGWEIIPLNRHANYNRQISSIEVSFNLPKGWGVFSNLNKLSNNTYRHLHTKDVFAVIGPNVSFKPHFKNWGVYNGDPFNANHIMAQNLQNRLNNHLETFYKTTLPDDYKLLNPSEALGYHDPGCGIVFLPHEKNLLTSIDAAIALSVLQTHIKTSHRNDFFQEPWSGDGLARFMRDEYIELSDADIRLSSGLPEALRLLTRIFPVGDFPLTYQNHIMYYYLARQGLDQEAGAVYSDISPGNYLAIVEGKTSIGFMHLRGRLGRQTFYRSMQEWFENLRMADVNAYDALKNTLNNNTPKNTAWFFDHYLDGHKKVDYRVSRIQSCSSVYAVTVRNKGKAAVPFSLTGIKDGEEIITIWYEGHTGKKTIQFHLEDYDEIVLDQHLKTIDLNPRNNRRKSSGLFKGLQPVKWQVYTDIENPRKEQVFFYPVGGFNAYDGLYGGVSFYNRTSIPKKFEYRIEPTYSTLTRSLTGSFSLKANLTPSEGWFHRIEPGFFFHHYHYDVNLGYFRYSPFVRFWWRKSHPRSENIHRTRIRYLRLDRETLAETVNPNAEYQLLQFTHDFENVNILRPCSIRTQFEVSDEFTKLQIDIDQRWMLPNKKWMSTRFFAGAFLTRSLAEGNQFFDFGMSGTLDYAFDYYLFGRSETSGLLSQQMIMTDGGFKSQTNAFASQWLTAFNTYVPIWKVFGVFGDVGLADNINTVYWGYGVRLGLLSDFFEIYLPIQNQDRIMWEHAYPSEIRFMLNLDINQIIQRVRRGWY